MPRLLPAFCSLLLAACSSGKIPFDQVEDAGDVEDLCDEYDDRIEDDTLTVLFVATTEDCAWGEDGNTQMQDLVLTARVEQTESLDIDDDVVMCDMDLDLSGLVPGEIQLMVYDDYFFFTFNDIVLASSHEPAVAGLDTDDDLPVYDWERIVGTPFPHGDAPFCLGEESGDADCDIPGTETEGPISLSFGSDIVNELSARAFDEGRFDFGFVTTGDNDPETDCRHAEFGFTVDVEYLAE